jgi:hypothetical protein
VAVALPGRSGLRLRRHGRDTRRIHPDFADSFAFSIAIYLAQIPGYHSAAFVGEYLDRKRTLGHLLDKRVSSFSACNRIVNVVSSTLLF